eukprot:769426_1
MSNIKSEASCYASAYCQDQSYSDYVIKREFSAQVQPPTAAFRCEFCAKTFNLKQYLINHVVQIHDDTCLSVKYEQHSSKFVMAPPVNNLPHEETISSSTSEYVHSGSSTQFQQSFKCSACQKVLNCRTSLKAHMTSCHSALQLPPMLVHSGARPHICEICQKSFSEKRNLNHHVLIHVKPHSCGICQKSFSIKKILNQHLLIHSGAKDH